MIVVAVVGGSGNVGKSIVDGFLEDGSHQVIVLGRKVSSYSYPIILQHFNDTLKVPEENSSVPMFAIDYDDVEKITQVLDDQKVHTVISTIVMYDSVAAKSERNLIAAAAKSGTVKRFVQSNWGDRTPEDE